MHPSRCCEPFVEDQAIEVPGEIGECEFGLPTMDAVGADVESKAVLLVGQDMFNPGADRGLCRIRARDVHRHRLALGLAAMDAAFEYIALQQCLILGATMGVVSPDISSGVACVDYAPQLGPIAVRAVKDPGPNT